MAGLTSNGFQKKTLEEIKAELVAQLRADLGAGLNIETASPLGQLVGAFSGQLAEVWELGQEVHASQSPETAAGWSLTHVAALTGTVRAKATKSTVRCNISAAAGSYAAGSLVAHVLGDPLSRFVNKTALTGTTLGALFEAETTGPVRADAGSLTVIAEPVAGWVSVSNPADAVLGRNEETDSELRTRRLEELSARGSSYVDAIRADLLQVTGVESCTVLENATDVTDGNGLPPHSVEAIVFGTYSGGDVAEALFKVKPAGIQAHGATSVSVTDSQGITHAIKYTAPTALPVYLVLNLTGISGIAPGSTALKQAIADWGNSLAVGQDVIASQIVGQIFKQPGIVDASVLQGLTVGPTGSFTITVGTRQVASFDTSRITVNWTLLEANP
jgi:uncharacterized phage protein gp47/JayE